MQATGMPACACLFDGFAWFSPPDRVIFLAAPVLGQSIAQFFLVTEYQRGKSVAHTVEVGWSRGW